jgi:Uma2 family endonuclease
MNSRGEKMLTAAKRKTVKDFNLLPEGAPFQLIGGELVMSPSPLYEHQRIIAEIAISLALMVKEKKIGNVILAPMDVYLSETEAYQPDVIFVSNE